MRDASYETSKCLFLGLMEEIMRSKQMKTRFFGLLVTAVIATLALVTGNRGAQAIVLEFDTELVSLDLTGGPFPIPL